MYYNTIGVITVTIISIIIIFVCLILGKYLPDDKLLCQRCKKGADE